MSRDKQDQNTYKDAGVNIDAGNQAVQLMRAAIEKTHRPEVISSIGGFAGLFALSDKYREPVLVSGTDGVGTKLKVAQMMNVHDTIGIDLVAMCVNDILVCGAEPLFFLDYLAVGALDPTQAAEIVEGVAQGCRMAGCALIGGETAEMPGFYQPGEYDVAGFALGVVERSQIIDGRSIKDGDMIIGLASNGIHSNGLSLARKVLFDDAGLSIDDILPQYAHSIGEELLRPTSIYFEAIKAAMACARIKGMAHITGGGLSENILRVVPDGLAVSIETGSWVIPEIFATIKSLGNVPDTEMYRTFNMGIGMALVIDEHDSVSVMTAMEETGVEAVAIGCITKGKRGVVYG